MSQLVLNSLGATISFDSDSYDSWTFARISVQVNTPSSYCER
jgi:hypothetical protein